MRQLVSVVDDDAVRLFISDGEGEYEQIAQTINPGLDVRAVLELGSVMTDVLKLNGKTPRKRATASAIESAHDDDDETRAIEPPRRSPGRPRGPQKRAMRSWGFHQSVVYDKLRELGPCSIQTMVEAFGFDPKADGAQSAMSQTLQALYRSGAATRQTLDPYSVGNATPYSRALYTAVVPETSADVEQSSDD